MVYGQEFHWQDGWFFSRNEDGSVHVRHESKPVKIEGETITPFENDVDITIDGYSWCSIIAFAADVIGYGGDATKFEAAKRFHNLPISKKAP